MNEDDVLQQNNEEFLRKRYNILLKEKDTLKAENKALREELAVLKDSLKEIYKERIDSKANGKVKSNNGPPLVVLNNSDEKSFRIVLEFQRARIEALEKENETIKNKYEKVLFDKPKDGLFVPRSSVLFENYSNCSEELIEANSKIVDLEAKIKELTASTAKEISTLKAKLAKQDAALIISSNSINSVDNSLVLERPSTMSKFNQSITNSKNILAPLGQAVAMSGSNNTFSNNPTGSERSQRGSFSGGLPEQKQPIMNSIHQPKIGRLPSNSRVTQSYDEGSIFNYSKKK